MATVLLSALELKTNSETVPVEINGQTIEVKQFLPTFDKINLVASAVKSSIVDGVVNEMIVETTLHYLIVEHYTNLEFTEEELANMVDTYDLLESNDVIDAVLSALPEGDYDELFEATKAQSDKVDKFIASSLQGYAGHSEANKSLEDMFGSMAKEKEAKNKPKK